VSGVVLTVDGDPSEYFEGRWTVRIDGDLPIVSHKVKPGEPRIWQDHPRRLRVGDKVALAHCDTKTTEEVDRWAEASYANPSIVTPPEMGYRPNDDGSWTCRHPHPFATATVAGVKRVDLLGEPEGYVVTVTDVEALS